MALNIKPCKDGIQFSATIQPRSSKNKICGLHGESLKIRLTSPPVDGKTNKLCIKLLSKMLDVSPSHIIIVNGYKSRNKTIQVEGISTPEFFKRIAQTYESDF